MCDSWIATKDYYTQIHELPRKRKEEERRKRRLESVGHGGFVSPIADRFQGHHRSPSPGIPSHSHDNRRSLPPKMNSNQFQHKSQQHHHHHHHQNKMISQHHHQKHRGQQQPQHQHQNSSLLKVQSYSPQSNTSGNSYSSNFNRLNLSMPNMNTSSNNNTPIPPVPPRNPPSKRKNNSDENNDHKVEAKNNNNTFTPPKHFPPATNNDENNPNGSKRHKHD